MIWVYVVVVILISLDVFLILRWRQIKRNGEVIIGRIINKVLHDDFEARSYIYTIEYSSDKGSKGIIKTRLNFTVVKREIGDMVELYKFKTNEGIKVLHLSTFSNIVFFITGVIAMLVVLIITEN